MSTKDEQDGRKRRGQESREARRALILESALGVFAEQGYHSTSVTDLVKAAGVARGTFYLYFEGKEAIFAELLDGLTETLRASIVGVSMRETAPSIEEQLHKIIVHLFGVLQENRSLTRIIFREAIGLHEDVESRLNAFFDELYMYLEGALALGQQGGWVSDSIDLQTTATCVVGAVRQVVDRKIVGQDGPIDSSALATGILAFTMGGLKT